MATGSRLFNGTTDRIDWTNIFDFRYTPITLSFWCKVTGAPAKDERIFNIYSLGNTHAGIIVYFEKTSGKLFFVKVGSGGNLGRGTSASAITSGVWENCVITHDGSTSGLAVRIYRNGLELACTYHSDANGEYAEDGSWSIGGEIFGDTYNVPGNICQFAAWNRVLGDGEIANLGAGYSPSVYPVNLRFYFKGDTVSLQDEITGTVGVADGTTFSTDGPTVYGVVYRQLSLDNRSLSLALPGRSRALSLSDRSLALSVPGR
jgi:hypothetical protein